MDIRQTQHNRIVVLVGIIVGLAIVSLWREFAHANSNGLQLNFASAGTSGMIGAFILVMMGAGSIVVQRSSRDTRKVAELAFIDELTGLPNRRQFDIRLQQELDRHARHGGRLATLYFDLDKFKAINDCYGHAAGDLAIQTFGARIEEAVRNEDTVARLSGDEFAAILPEVSAREDLTTLSDRIIEAMRKPIKINGKSIYVGVSIGGAIINNGEVDAPEALRQADFALLQAKASGCNQLQIFDPEMAESMKAKKLMEADLREAVMEDELHLDYQPQVSQDGKTILGVEALVRWTHKEAGPIPPSTFIPIAEEIGLIEQLGETILRQACSDIKGLNNTKLAVNVSPVQFRQSNFVEIVESVLEETGFDPKQLELEITEGIFVSNPEQTVNTIKTIRALGVGIALDDFGTGYSSMSYLREFPLDRIKIDRSFVTEMGNSKDALQLVSTMIELGSGLGLNVTVEGVETHQQMDLLSETRCDELQGFLFSRPVSAEQLTKMASLSRSNDLSDAYTDTEHLALAS